LTSPAPESRCPAWGQGGARNSADGFDLSEAAGVIPRAIHQIFTTLDAHGAEYTVKCSFLELYQARAPGSTAHWWEEQQG
jgi:kynureninase